MAIQTEEQLHDRLAARDQSLWPEGNTSPQRLGWLDVPLESERTRKELTRWAGTVDEETVVVLGMGASSLIAKVLGEAAEGFSSPSGRRIFVGDTTDPESLAALPLEDAFVLMCSKTGSGLETQALFDYARTRNADPKRFAVISDPGTTLSRQAEELRVQRVFTSQHDLPGCYNALSHFGTVPAVLLGYDLEEFCGRALEIDRHKAVALGVELAEAALEGVNKLTLLGEARSFGVGRFHEQLLASATGKQGRGIVPILSTLAESGPDRQLLPIGLSAAHELGALFFSMQITAAIAAHVLEVDPFDEPDVALSLEQTNALLADLPLPKLSALDSDALDPYLRETLREGDYLSLEAYLPNHVATDLELLRGALRDRLAGHAVTANLGPRVLHATGQLHKGGPSSVVTIQIVPRAGRVELPLPGWPYDLGSLTDALLLGDGQALQQTHRRVLRIAVDELGELT